MPSPDLAPPPFRDLPSFRLHLLVRLTEREAEADFQRRFGLSLLECRIIGLTGALGATSLKRLQAEAELDKAQASRLVARLVSRGFIVKHANPDDARSPLIALTPAGRAMGRAIHAAASLRNANWLSVLSEAERTTLLECVDKLTRAARGEVGAAPDPAPAPILLDAVQLRSLHAAIGAVLNLPAGGAQANEQNRIGL